MEQPPVLHDQNRGSHIGMVITVVRKGPCLRKGKTEGATDRKRSTIKGLPIVTGDRMGSGGRVLPDHRGARSDRENAGMKAKTAIAISDDHQRLQRASNRRWRRLSRHRGRCRRAHLGCRRLSEGRWGARAGGSGGATAGREQQQAR